MPLKFSEVLSQLYREIMQQVQRARSHRTIILLEIFPSSDVTPAPAAHRVAQAELHSRQAARGVGQPQGWVG